MESSHRGGLRYIALLPRVHSIKSPLLLLPCLWPVPRALSGTTAGSAEALGTFLACGRQSALPIMAEVTAADEAMKVGTQHVGAWGLGLPLGTHFSGVAGAALRPPLSAVGREGRALSAKGWEVAKTT